jgi:histidinol-phosphate aminotransferase
MGARIVEVRASSRVAFQPDVRAAQKAAARSRPRVAWICNPNNPTGAYVSEAVVTSLISDFPATLWVIDEAYRPFVDAPWASLPLIDRGNVLLLRSLTKDCDLPGLRIGYALAAPGVVAALRKATPPWSAGAAAIAGGMAALKIRDRCLASSAALRSEAAWLAAAMVRQGWQVLPSDTHFFLVATASASALRSRLLREHCIQVRDCTSFGLPQHVRIAARTRGENERLVQAMEAVR